MTADYNGYQDRPEDEREQSEPFDCDEGEEWRGGEPLGAGDEWKSDGWRYGDMTPEEKMWRDLLEDEEGGS